MAYFTIAVVGLAVAPPGQLSARICRFGFLEAIKRFNH